MRPEVTPGELFAILDRAYFDGGTGPLRITPESIGEYTAPADPDTEILTHAEQERRYIQRVLDHCMERSAARAARQRSWT